MEDNQISIAGIDKAAILKALYNASKQQGMGFMDSRGSNAMHIEQAEDILKQKGNRLYFDYLFGRVMKVDLSGDTLETWGYDRDNGTGAAANALSNARLI